MKKFLLLTLLLGWTTYSFSQQRFQFGFVAKTGNFNLPYDKTIPFEFDNNLSTQYEQKMGAKHEIGTWGAIPLNPYLKLSAEVLFRVASFSLNTRLRSNNTWQIFNFDQVQKVNEASITVPVSMHYRFKKNGKSSILVGGGLARGVWTRIYTGVKSQFSNQPETSSYYTRTFSKRDEFETNTFYTLGFQYQLDSRTTIGLEYLHQKPLKVYQQYPNVFLNPFVDCLCFYIEPDSRPDLNSFSVSLRHNILE